MFSYLRYFSIVSFIIVVLAAAGLGVYFRHIAASDLANIAEKSSLSIAQGYVNTTWKEHLSNLRRLSQLDISTWSRYKEFVAFSEDTFRHFEGVPVTQINLYTAKGEKVLSIAADAEIHYNNEAAVPTLSNDENIRARFAEALRGEVTSQIVPNSSFRMPTGETREGTVIQTFIPIMPDNYASVIAGNKPLAEGVMEIFYDITPQYAQLYLFQVISTGGILLIFVILIGALYFTSKKAESIITTQHETNVELAATAAKAEAESRQKSQFLANVSHELRTPLNAIIGFSEIIKNEVMGKLGNDTYMNYIKDIHSSGVHLLSLINDILDFSKAEAGKLDLHLSELDLTKLIKNCMRLVSPRAEQANVNLATEVPKEHFIITGDAKKLKQVLLNLLSNAVKFTPENGEVRVTAWQNVMDDSIAIEVRDSGIGIAPKDISRAMAPFGQVDSALSRKYEGTGLGLPLTKKFVEIMGGTFRIESEVNVGTTITITVPLTPPRHVLQAAGYDPETAGKERAREEAEPAHTTEHEELPQPAPAPLMQTQNTPFTATEPAAAPQTGSGLEAPDWNTFKATAQADEPATATEASVPSLMSGGLEFPNFTPAESAPAPQPAAHTTAQPLFGSLNPAQPHEAEATHPQEHAPQASLNILSPMPAAQEEHAAETPAPHPAPTTEGGHSGQMKFTSYAELKAQMMAQQKPAPKDE